MTEMESFNMNILKAYICNKQNNASIKILGTIPTNFISSLLSIKKWFTSKPWSALPIAFILSSRVNSFFQRGEILRTDYCIPIKELETRCDFLNFSTIGTMSINAKADYRMRGLSHLHIINENIYLFRSTKLLTNLHVLVKGHKFYICSNANIYSFSKSSIKSFDDKSRRNILLGLNGCINLRKCHSGEQKFSFFNDVLPGWTVELNSRNFLIIWALKLMRTDVT